MLGTPTPALKSSLFHAMLVKEIVTQIRRDMTCRCLSGTVEQYICNIWYQNKLLRSSWPKSKRGHCPGMRNKSTWHKSDSPRGFLLLGPVGWPFPPTLRYAWTFFRPLWHACTKVLGLVARWNSCLTSAMVTLSQWWRLTNVKCGRFLWAQRCW